MKRICVIMLAGILAFMACDAVQFMKVPQMFRHYMEHVEINPTLSFADFLAEHYSNIPHTDNDDAEDMKLPFKQSECTAATMVFFFEHKSYTTLGAPIYQEKTYSLYCFSSIPSDDANSIWQPPKQA